MAEAFRKNFTTKRTQKDQTARVCVKMLSHALTTSVTMAKKNLKTGDAITELKLLSQAPYFR